MGTWGPNSFENDTAADFVDALAGPDALKTLLKSADLAPDLDAEAAEKVIAAADCVAIMLGRIGPGTQKAIAKKIQSFGLPEPELVDAAKHGVSRVLMGGELLELWGETEASDFNEAITLLMQRLNPEIEVASHAPIEPYKLKINCAFCDKPVDPDNLLELAVQINGSTLGAEKHYKPCHHVCLNRALHPKYLVQHWEFTDEDIDRLTAHMKT